MYGLGPQKFLSQAAKQKPGDSSKIQNDKEPGPANHPNTADENKEMNKSGNEDMENNSDMNMSKAKSDRPKSSPVPDDTGGEDEGFFAALKTRVKDYVMKKGTDGMMGSMESDTSSKAEGGKESNLAEEKAPKENRPGIDKPERPERNNPKTKVPKTPPGPVNNTPIPKIPSPARFKAPKIPRPRM